jgi:hypothetical protein
MGDRRESQEKRKLRLEAMVKMYKDNPDATVKGVMAVYSGVAYKTFLKELKRLGLYPRERMRDTDMCRKSRTLYKPISWWTRNQHPQA